jgi:hypothetical protein
MYLPCFIVTFPLCCLISWEESRLLVQALTLDHDRERSSSLMMVMRSERGVIAVGSAHLPSPGTAQVVIARRVFIAVIPLSFSMQAMAMASAIPPKIEEPLDQRQLAPGGAVARAERHQFFELVAGAAQIAGGE